MKRKIIKLLSFVAAYLSALFIGWCIAQYVCSKMDLQMFVVQIAVGAMVVVIAARTFNSMDGMIANEAGKIPGVPDGLQIGDVVNLKVSAHPKMVINYRTMSGYACCWFDGNNICQEHIFAEDALVLFKKNEG